MSAPIVVPFNFDPIATTVRTANYTIPAGRYARVTPLYNTGASNAHGSAANVTFTNVNIALNSVVLYRFACSGSISLFGQNVFRTMTFPAHGLCDFSGSGLRVQINGVEQTSQGGGCPTSFRFFAASAAFAPLDANVQNVFVRWTYPENVPSFFARAGDIISLTGSPTFLTEEYNRIS